MSNISLIDQIVSASNHIHQHGHRGTASYVQGDPNLIKALAEVWMISEEEAFNRIVEINNLDEQ